jgi:hypothetical protein
MNVVLPVDFQSYPSAQNASGTAEARADNAQRPAILPAQQNESSKQSSQKQAEQNSGQSNQELAQQTAKFKDKVTLSKQGQIKQEQEVASKKADTPSSAELTEEDEKKVQSLKDRDREVRIHEQAHAAVGGQYAGAPSYEYESGPDGKRYAVGGEVSIDVSEENEPEDTIQKMQVVRAAALAPAEPSTQDIKVAAEASQKEQRARAQVSQDRLSPEDDDAKSTSKPNQTASEQQSILAQSYADISATRVTSQFSASA